MAKAAPSRPEATLINLLSFLAPRGSGGPDRNNFGPGRPMDMGVCHKNSVSAPVDTAWCAHGRARARGGGGGRELPLSRHALPSTLPRVYLLFFRAAPTQIVPDGDTPNCAVDGVRSVQWTDLVVDCQQSGADAESGADDHRVSLACG